VLRADLSFHGSVEERLVCRDPSVNLSPTFNKDEKVEHHIKKEKSHSHTYWLKVLTHLWLKVTVNSGLKFWVEGGVNSYGNLARVPLWLHCPRRRTEV